MALAAAAAIGAGTAAAAYLEAKYHIKKDAKALYSLKMMEREYSEAVKANRQSCFYFFEDNLSNWPDIVAIWSREGSYTFKETHTRACQYACYFLGLGIQPGQLVAFYLQNSPEFIFAWLGLWAIGCAPAMINFNLAGGALIHCLKVSGAEVLIVDEDEKVKSRIEGERKIIEEELGMRPIVLSESLKAQIALRLPERPDDSYREGVTANFPAALFYTSGTTGLPKGAQFATSRMYKNASRRGRGVADLQRGPNGDRWYICMPLYHGTGGITGLNMLISGMSLAIGKGFSVRNFWSDVHDSESTFFIYVGETARYLLAAPPSSLDKDHKVRCMYGNGLRPDVWLRFRERFNVPEVGEFFNSSEGVLSLFIWNRGDYSANCVGHHGALMRYLFHNYFVPVEIDHETNDIVRDPETGWAKRNSYIEGGEIIVNLTEGSTFAGYWNNPDATQKKFVRDVFTKGDLYYRSGDALRRTADGRWFFMDRLGDTYRWKSENVSTAEVAETIGHFPGVLEANVYGVELPSHEGRAGCAALTIAPEQKKSFDWNGLAEFTKARMPRYAVPVFVRVLNEEVGGAASHNNKQDKVKLRAEGVDPEKRGEKVVNGKGDEIYWIPPRGIGYVRFEDEDWRNLVSGKARL